MSTDFWNKFVKSHIFIKRFMLLLLFLHNLITKKYTNDVFRGGTVSDFARKSLTNAPKNWYNKKDVPDNGAFRQIQPKDKKEIPK